MGKQKGALTGGRQNPAGARKEARRWGRAMQKSKAHRHMYEGAMIKRILNFLRKNTTLGS